MHLLGLKSKGAGQKTLIPALLTLEASMFLDFPYIQTPTHMQWEAVNSLPKGLEIPEDNMDSRRA